MVPPNAISELSCRMPPLAKVTLPPVPLSSCDLQHAAADDGARRSVPRGDVSTPPLPMLMALAVAPASTICAPPLIIVPPETAP